jgi:hypothetical protein
MPTWVDYDTVKQPFPLSTRIEFYSDLWGYDVLCHPDAWRDPRVVLLWMGGLWIGVLVGGTWVLWKRGEMSARYANCARWGVYAVVPFMGWVSFGGSVVLVGMGTMFAFLAGATRGRGEWIDPGRVVRCGVERAREVWVEGTWLACGNVRELPVQRVQGTMEEPVVLVAKEVEEEKIRKEADLGKEERIGMRLCDEEKRMLDSDTLDSSTPCLSVPVDADDTTTPIALRWLQVLAFAPLAYLSIVTLLLCERRTSINANAIVDDILWHLALTGLAICAQATLIILFRATAPGRHNSKQQPAVTVPLIPPTDGISTQTTDPIEPPKRPISRILLVRFGGLVHGVNTNTKDRDRSSLMAFGRLGPFDTFASMLIFQHLVYPRSGNDDYPYLDTLIDVASKTVLLGMLPYLWIIAFAFVALILTVAHLLLSRVLPNSRAVTALESLSPKMEDLVRWVKARYAKLPQTWRWILERCYFPLWILSVYGVLYVIVVQEVVRFDTRERLRANNFDCLDLWRDHLAEKLLWPIFSAVRR